MIDTDSLDSYDAKIIKQFEETLRKVKDAKTPKERAKVLLAADAQAKADALVVESVRKLKRNKP